MSGDKDETRRIWFPAKRYGWGWGLPVAWQGWVVLLLYAAVIGATWRLLPPDRHPAVFGLIVAVATIALLATFWWKGERLRWRWGSH